MGYEPVGWSITYTTNLRDELFSPTPLGELEGHGIAPGYTNAFCFAPHLFGRSTLGVGIELLDFRPPRSLGTFTNLTDDAGNDAQIYADASRVMLIRANDVLLWERKSRRFAGRWNLRRGKDDEVGLTSIAYVPRAGVILQGAGPQLRIWSARTGKLLHVARYSLADFDAEYGEAKDASHVSFSPDASECFYNTTIYTSKPDSTDDEMQPRDGALGPTHVASCQSGLTLWTIAPAYNLVFSGDERTILAQHEGVPVVEVRDVQSGRVLRKVNIRPNCTALGSSADGRALYTHDKNGRVWKQGLF